MGLEYSHMLFVQYNVEFIAFHQSVDMEYVFHVSRGLIALLIVHT